MIEKFWCFKKGFFCFDGINQRTAAVVNNDMTLKEWNESLVDCILNAFNELPYSAPTGSLGYLIEASTSAYDIINESILFKRKSDYSGTISGKITFLNKSLNDCIEIKELCYLDGVKTVARITIL